jgi:hypothetical protein
MFIGSSGVGGLADSALRFSSGVGGLADSALRFSSGVGGFTDSALRSSSGVGGTAVSALRCSTNVCRACENVCKCGNTVQGEVNTVKGYDNHVNVNPGLLASCSSLNELTLPIYSDHTTQIIGNFLKDLDLYFDPKGVVENLKLPLAARALQDPFTKAWHSAEYYKLVTYQNFKTQVTQLLWNDQKQSSIRC